MGRAWGCENRQVMVVMVVVVVAAVGVRGQTRLLSQHLPCPPSVQVHHFDRYWSNGKVQGFEVYVVELMESIDVCVERNVHQRTREEIEKVRWMHSRLGGVN